MPSIKWASLHLALLCANPPCPVCSRVRGLLPSRRAMQHAVFCDVVMRSSDRLRHGWHLCVSLFASRFRKLALRHVFVARMLPTLLLLRLIQETPPWRRFFTCVFRLALFPSGANSPSSIGCALSLLGPCPCPAMVVSPAGSLDIGESAGGAGCIARAYGCRAMSCRQTAWLAPASAVRRCRRRRQSTGL